MNKKRIIVFLAALIAGFVWGIVYLFIVALHGMIQMFNNEFIFLTASIFKVPMTTKTLGFTFAFIDGALFGFLFGLIFTKIKKR